MLPPGIFIGPNAEKVIASGDALFGSTVFALVMSNDLSLTSHSLNDAGQIAFRYVLANGRSGIALATPIPEPSAAALLLIGALFLTRTKQIDPDF
jgi:hypothetical protein